jgi:hypothetical protein
MLCYNWDIDFLLLTSITTPSPILSISLIMYDTCAVPQVHIDPLVSLYGVLILYMSPLLCSTILALGAGPYADIF